MSSTTPAPERAPRDRAGETARPVPVPVPAAVPAAGRAPAPAAVPAVAGEPPGAAMRTLLAARAAAEAVSTPPAHRRPHTHRTAA